MGQIRRAKDGHYYSVKRSYGGRYRTIQHGYGTVYTPYRGSTASQYVAAAIVVPLLVILGIVYAPQVLVSTLVTATLIGLITIWHRHRFN